MKTIERWQTGRLGELCSIEIGGTPSRSNPAFWDPAKETSNVWVSIKDLNQTVIMDTVEHISDLGVKHSNVKLQNPGTILLSFKLSIGRVAFAGVPLYTNEAIAGLNSEKIDLNYLFHGLHQWDLLQGVDQAIKGATLNKEKLKKITFKYPTSPSEQTKIAEILSTVDRAIEQTEALIAKQQHIKTSLMQDLLTRGIDEEGNLRSEETHEFKDSPLGRIPVEWEMVPLLSFASKSPSSFVNGPFGSDLLASELKVEGVPVIYVRDIKPGVYQRVSTVHVTQTKANQLDACNVHYGDILVAKVGDPPCDAAPYFHHERSIVTQDVIRIQPSNEVVSLFLCHLLNSHIGRKAIKEIIIQGTRSRVSLTEFKTLKLPKPNREEQKSIAEIIDSIQQAIQKKQSRLHKLNYIKTALMQDLLTGKKRVTALLNDTEVVHG